MEHDATKIGITGGLLIAFGMITVMKYVSYKMRKNDKPFNFKYWFANNWMEYPIHLFLSWLVFYFDHDFINLINYLLNKTGMSWEMMHFDNSSFYFVAVPVALTLASYKWLRKKADRAQEKLAPHIHDEFCKHD